MKDPATTATEVDIMEKIRSGEAVAQPNPFVGQSMPDVEQMTVRVNARLSMSLMDRIEAANHPDGVSGAIREALEEWLARHEGREAEVQDAMAALKTLERVVSHLQKDAA